MTRITLEVDDEVREAMTKHCFLADACGQGFGILFNVAIKILHGLEKGEDVIQLKYKKGNNANTTAEENGQKAK